METCRSRVNMRVIEINFRASVIHSLFHQHCLWRLRSSKLATYNIKT